MVATVGVAVGVGHFMQYGLSVGGGSDVIRAEAYVADPAPASPQASATAEATASFLPDALPTPPAAALMPVTLDRKVVARTQVPKDSFQSPRTDAHENLNAFGIPCETRLTATPLEDAMVHLKLSATCRPTERVEIAHGPLRFAMMTSAVGDLEVRVPAMTPSAQFTASFSDRTKARAIAVLPDAADHDRVALQWTGDSAMSIHAFEFGAGQNDPGHVHRNMREAAIVRTDETGGRIFSLGDRNLDAPSLAEVYSFPRGSVERTGVVRLHVEAEVTPFTCGKETSAEAVQTGPEGPRAITVRLAMPDCDAVGDILVLKNILRDLKIASN